MRSWLRPPARASRLVDRAQQHGWSKQFGDGMAIHGRATTMDLLIAGVRLMVGVSGVLRGVTGTLVMLVRGLDELAQSAVHLRCLEAECLQPTAFLRLQTLNDLSEFVWCHRASPIPIVPSSNLHRVAGHHPDVRPATRVTADPTGAAVWKEELVEFETFTTCWPGDDIKAKGYSSEIQKVVNVKDTFTRINLERERELRKRQESQEAERRARDRQRETLDLIQRDLSSLFAETDPQRRDKRLEAVLNRLFDAYGILIVDHRRDLTNSVLSLKASERTALGVDGGFGRGIAVEGGREHRDKMVE